MWSTGSFRRAVGARDCRERGDVLNICVRWTTLTPLSQTVQGSEEFTEKRISLRNLSPEA